MNRLTLRFSPEQERAFQQDFAERSLNQLRFSLLCGCFLYAIFGLLDAMLIPEAKWTTWFIRYAIVCPVMLLAWLITRSSALRRHAQPLLVVLVIVAGSGIIAMTRLAAAPGGDLYYAGLMLVIMWCYTFTTAHYVQATLAAWSVFLGYELLTFVSGNTPTPVFISNSFFFLSANLMGMAVSYLIERYKRRDFVQRRLLEIERAKSDALLSSEQRRAENERQRVSEQLQLARHIQLSLLPHELPILPGYELARVYEPALEIGGDFYDVIDLPGGKIALIIGDVSSKGVPAALVMAMTRTILRTAARRYVAPSIVLFRTNDILQRELMEHMFVTCFYAVLDPASGQLRFANAGHDCPCRANAVRWEELRARGMPLGMLPGMTYDEFETTLNPGETLLMYSDGLVEAHDPQRRMFGSDRVRETLRRACATPGDSGVTERLMKALRGHVGDGWTQEDDITLFTIRRAPADLVESDAAARAARSARGVWMPSVLRSFSVTSVAGNERLAAERVVDVLRGMSLPAEWLGKLRTAVATAVMHMIVYGNHSQPDLAVGVTVSIDTGILSVSVNGPAPGNRARDGDGPAYGLGDAVTLIRPLVDDARVLRDPNGAEQMIEFRLSLPTSEAL